MPMMIVMVMMLTINAMMIVMVMMLTINADDDSYGHDVDD